MAKKGSLGLQRPGRVLNNAYQSLRLKPDLLEGVLSAPDDERFRLLRDMCFDPQYSKQSFVQLCRRADITLQEFLDALRSYKITEALITGLQDAPQLVGWLKEAAANRKVFCPLCTGTGKLSDVTGVDDDGAEIISTRTCPQCKGKKEVLAIGDDKARAQYLEMVGLTGKERAVPATATQINVNVGGQRLEEVVTVTEKIVKGDP